MALPNWGKVKKILSALADFFALGRKLGFWKVK